MAPDRVANLSIYRVANGAKPTLLTLHGTEVKR